MLSPPHSSSAVVAGKLAYDKQEELFFAHIRPRAERPPLDPGEEAEEEADEDEEEDEDEEQIV